MPTLPILPVNNCTTAFIMAKSNSLFVVHLLAILINIACILLFYLNLKLAISPNRKSLHLHTNLKIIFLGGSLIYLSKAAMEIVININYISAYFKDYSSTCLYTITSWKCMLMKIPSTTFIIGFTFYHLVIFLERSFASFYVKTYEKMSVKAGIFAMTFMGCTLGLNYGKRVFFTILVTVAGTKDAICIFRSRVLLGIMSKLVLTLSFSIFIFYDDDFASIKSYCTGSSTQIVNKLSVMNYSMLAIDLVVTFGDAYLRVYINKQHKNKININYNLHQAYQIRENSLSIKLIFPLSLIHSSIFLTYLVLVLVVKNLLYFKDAETYIIFIESTALLVSIYVFCTFTIFLWLRLKIERSTNSARKGDQEIAADVYFKQFHNQIG